MIGREKERRSFAKAMAAKESQFIALYGRRRVGKTYLVRESLGRDFVFDHVRVYDRL